MRFKSAKFISLFIASFVLGRLTLSFPVHADNDRASVVADQKKGVIRFLIDGKEVALIDATGLGVRGNIIYSGATIDTGNDDFENSMFGAPHAP